MLHHVPTYRSALSLFRGLLEYGNTSFRSFNLGLQSILIFIHLEFDAVCNNLLWVEISSEGVSVYSCIFTRYFLNFNIYFFNFIKILEKNRCRKIRMSFQFFFTQLWGRWTFYFIYYVCSIPKPIIIWIFLRVFYQLEWSIDKMNQFLHIEFCLKFQLIYDHQTPQPNKYNMLL